jgi:hypothetical protein
MDRGPDGQLPDLYLGAPSVRPGRRISRAAETTATAAKNATMRSRPRR